MLAVLPVFHRSFNMGCQNSKDMEFSRAEDSAGNEYAETEATQGKAAPKADRVMAPIVDTNGFKRLLLISDNLPLPEILIRATLDDIIVIPVQYKSWDLSQLKQEILFRAGSPQHQFLTVGLLDHGKAGEFCLLESVAGGSIDMKDWEDALTAKELNEFFKFLASYVKMPKELHKWRDDATSRIDLMACDVAKTAEGMKLITHLEDITRVNWAASTNKTGAGEGVENGFDWVMETEEHLGLGDIAKHYFVEEKIRKWKHSAGALMGIAKFGACCAVAATGPIGVAAVAGYSAANVAYSVGTGDGQGAVLGSIAAGTGIPVGIAYDVYNGDLY